MPTTARQRAANASLAAARSAEDRRFRRSIEAMELSSWPLSDGVKASLSNLLRLNGYTVTEPSNNA